MLFLKIYIAVSIIVALVGIAAERRYENLIIDVPVGDAEFYERPVLTSKVVWVIFPVAFLINVSWRLFCCTVNAIIERI